MRQLCSMLLCFALLTAAQAQDKEDLIHTVGPGDTLISIANNYGVTLEDLLALNSLDPDAYLQIGQRLIVIPDGGGSGGGRTERGNCRANRRGRFSRGLSGGASS